MPDTRLIDVANHMLNVLVAELGNAGIDVPVRRYVAAGEIAHDLGGANCADQLAITWAGSYQGQPGLDSSGFPMRCAVPIAARYVVALLRCVPIVDAMGRPPDDDALSASGAEVMIDAMTLSKVIITQQLDQDLVPIPCSLVGIGNVLPFGPQGGVGGSVVTLEVSLV